MPTKPVADPQPFIVRRSSIQGRGGFASRNIAAGERIVEYGGERISWKEADTRYDDDAQRRHHTFLFAVTSRTVIDGAVQGNDARFINHSCDPNCEAIDDDGRIYIEALRDIAAGEELYYDYAYARDESTTAEDEKLYMCRCGTAACRGSILEPPKQKKELPKTHHVAARHPHEHVGATSPASALTSRSKSKAKTKTKARTKTKAGSKTRTKATTGTKGTSKTKAKSGTRVKVKAKAKGTSKRTSRTPSKPGGRSGGARRRSRSR